MDITIVMQFGFATLLPVAACAVLTLLLAVFVGGLQIDVRSLWYRIRLLFHQLKR